MVLIRNSSNISESKIFTSLFVQKPYLKTKEMESNIEEDFDMKNQSRIKHVKGPVSIGEAASKKYVGNFFNKHGILKKTGYVDSSDNKLDNVRFVKINSMPAVGEHLTTIFYVVQAISNSVDEYSFLLSDPDEKLK